MGAEIHGERSPNVLPRRIAHLAALAAGAISGAMLAEAAVSWARLRLRPAPGTLVDIGGPRLHMRIGGPDKSPTIIFEAGLGGSSILWTLVQAQVETFARACSYDRAGYGYSDFGKLPRTGARMAEELHAALTRAKLAPPYIIVAHSYGGMVARLFASRYPAEVAGVVFVDAVHGVAFHEAQRVMRRVLQSWGYMLGGMALLGTLGILRLAAHVRGPHVILGLPPLPLAIREELADSMPRDVIAALFELLSWETTLAQAQAAGLRSDLPVVTLTHARPPETKSPRREPTDYERLWEVVQQESLGLTTRVKLKTSQRSGHHILLDDPEEVVEAIRELVSWL
jgi:pimeloyl-ACP methyl ester carboxylesterase